MMQHSMTASKLSLASFQLGCFCTDCLLNVQSALNVMSCIQVTLCIFFKAQVHGGGGHYLKEQQQFHRIKMEASHAMLLELSGVVSSSSS